MTPQEKVVLEIVAMSQAKYMRDLAAVLCRDAAAATVIYSIWEDQKKTLVGHFKFWDDEGKTE